MSDRNKMKYGGQCNRTACSSQRPAVYWNWSTRQFYCGECALLINRWKENIRPDGSPLCQWVPRGLAESPDKPIPLIPEIPLPAGEDKWLDMYLFWRQQRIWSYNTFGPPEFKGPRGPAEHLKKEAQEVYNETDPLKQKMEIVDCLFLVFDMAHRAGISYIDLANMAFEKLKINKARTWPNWRGTDPDKAIEHDRTGEKP